SVGGEQIPDVLFCLGFPCAIHILGRCAWRNLPDDGLARYRSTARATAAHTPPSTGQPEGSRVQRLRRFVSVRAVSHDRDYAFRLLQHLSIDGEACEQRRNLPDVHRDPVAAWHFGISYSSNLRSRDVEFKRISQFTFVKHGARFLQAA